MLPNPDNSCAIDNIICEALADGRGAAHTETMAEAFVVSVTTEVEVMGARAQSLWAVVAKSPEEAISLVRASIAPGATADRTIGKLLPETVKRLGLQPGQPKHL